MSVITRDSRALMFACILLFALTVFTVGCGDEEKEDDGTAATDASTTTVGTMEESQAQEITAYVEIVRELVNTGDELNSAYRDQVEQYNSGRLALEELIDRARRNAAAYRDMSDQLLRMDVPEDLLEAHELLVSGFGKWEQSFSLDVEGLSTGDSAKLDQARQLDSEAVDEVNEAINEINRLKE